MRSGSVDADATAVGLEVLRRGGNAVDAAVATGAALGVTEPYSAGVGGGGYFVVYDARTRKVSTIDGRETAPAGIEPDAFVDPATGKPYPFTPDLVTSGVSVGVPGTPATWETALDRWGTLSLAQALRPAAQAGPARLPRRRHLRAADAGERRALPHLHQAPRTCSCAAACRPSAAPSATPTSPAPTVRLGARGTDWLYRGRLGAEVAATVQHPPVSGATDLPVPVGSMTTADLARYRALLQKPTRTGYRGYDVYGMAPSSSGGTTVGESLNILEQSARAGHPGRRAAPVPRGLRARLRRPCQVRRRPRLHRCAHGDVARRHLCQGAGLPGRPREGRVQAGGGR
ncbi:hypothetical protein G5V59_12220 [Nocardioides sp. W3-2-3]|nr:hypothetical protein [Nocardioides convexus]